MATRLRIIVGKGGVGRTTISAGIARHAAAQGQRVLAVDAAGGRGLGEALGCPGPLPRGELTAVGVEGITALVLDTEAALDEYVRLNLHTPISPRIVRPVARIFEYVASAAPAVREILAIGKIGEEVRRGRWDRVIVDAPATGHAVELLSAPHDLARLVSAGPLARDTAWLTELLADPDVTDLVVVTTAEELPVTETLELVERLRSETRIRLDRVVLNRWPPPVSTAGRAEAEALDTAAHRAASPVSEPGEGDGDDGPRAAAGRAVLAALAAAAVARADQAALKRERLAALGAVISVIGESDDPVAAVEAAAATW
jgi:anion-transporting  ArsA/GET3 family ATPase